MFKIEKLIPIPSKSKYPFAKMEVGDSFYVKGDKKIISSVRVAARGYVMKTPNNSSQPVFVSRVDEDGVRIWRTK